MKKFVWFLPAIHCIFFDIELHEKRCFLDDVPQETQMIWTYNVKSLDEISQKWIDTPAGFGMHVEVTQKNEQYPILEKNYGGSAKFIYTTHRIGSHKVCLSSNSTDFFSANLGRLRITLTQRVGEEKPADLVEKFMVMTEGDHVSNLQFETAKITERNSQIERELAYHKIRAANFRKISEATNSAILYYSIIQIITVIILGCWQMHNLKSFFLKKKLV